MYRFGWYLLANGLYAPSSHYDPTAPTVHPGCIPPGVAQNGQLVMDNLGDTLLSPPTEPKNATNLDGSVCYVWPDPTGANFQVELFTPADMDLSLSFCSNPTSTRSVMTTTVPHFFSVPTSDSYCLCSETDFRDDFDVKMDAAFIYITWCSDETGTKTIWVMTIPISTVVATHTISPGAGCYPTIACCARNNRGGGSSPSFLVGYLTAVPGSAIAESWNGTWTSYNLTPTT